MADFLDWIENGTPEVIFEQFRARRAGIEQALTTDVEKFIQECDSSKDSLCLYGLPDESWQVGPPAEMVPHSLPEPALGINLVRNGMEQYAWLTMAANHSDSWLLAVAFYYASCSHFDKESREKLFNMINGLPTVKEIVTANTTANTNSTQGKNFRMKGEQEGKQRACGSGSSNY